MYTCYNNTGTGALVRGEFMGVLNHLFGDSLMYGAIPDYSKVRHFKDVKYLQYKGKLYKSDRVWITEDEDVYVLYALGACSGDWPVEFVKIGPAVTEIKDKVVLEMMSLLYGI